jgi:SAM-dependent methyltransferase
MGSPPSDEWQRVRAVGWDVSEGWARSDGVWLAGSGAAVDYPLEGHAALDVASSYWHDHRAAVVAAMLRRVSPNRAIWDVGAGTGSMASRLKAAAFDVVAVEPLPAGAAALARNFNGDVVCGTLADLQLPTGSIGAVGLFDVLEHLADPTALLAEVRRVLVSCGAGIAIVTVPALNWLWSDEDDVAGHHRRYRRAELDRLMRRSGFEPIETTYIFAILVPVAAVVRALPYRLGRRRSSDEILAAMKSQLLPRPWLERAIREVLHAESRVARLVRLPVGLSVVGVYRTAERSVMARTAPSAR